MIPRMLHLFGSQDVINNSGWTMWLRAGEAVKSRAGACANANLAESTSSQLSLIRLAT
jgi:hypothetical protein